MKYLKLFEDITTLEVPNKIEINDSVKDIFIELEDDGFEVRSNTFFDRSDNYMLYIYLEGRSIFEINDIRDKVEMIIDYMRMEWGDIRVKYGIGYIENGTELGSIEIDDILSKEFVLPDYRKISYVNIRISQINGILSNKPQKQSFIKKLFNKFK